MEWININDKEPVDNGWVGGTEYIVTIECDSWKERKTMVMSFEETVVRGKPVKRWKWNGRIKIDGWNVTHYMPFPKPCLD